MRFDCGETRGEKRRRLEGWHIWYAWYQVRLGSHGCRWLEDVERKGTWFQAVDDEYWSWTYRDIRVNTGAEREN